MPRSQASNGVCRSDFIKPFISVLLWLGFITLVPSIARAGPQGLSAEQMKLVQGLITDIMAQEHAPGATFAIGRDGRIIWAEGFGFSDIENHVPATAATVYRTASIGKPMTATAAMELWEEGKLDLDAPIQKYCPRFPKKRWTITTRDLLSHTSGIREPNETSELYNTRHYDRVSDALAIFGRDPLKMRPGSDFLYTTWGYVVLGCVLEGAAREEYRALMKRMIFDPAGMTSTRDDDPRAIIADRARGYIYEGGGPKNSGWADMSSKLPAGGWVTTATDLVRFMMAWMDGQYVSAETQALMLTPYRLPRHGGTVDGFGLGWFLEDYHGLRAGFHGGGTPQVSGIAFFVPGKRIAIAGIFNVQDISGAKRVTLAKAIIDAVLGPEPAGAHSVHLARR
jgi:CubicO group peptidase (beta-lactamase class C family)